MRLLQYIIAYLKSVTATKEAFVYAKWGKHEVVSCK